MSLSIIVILYFSHILYHVACILHPCNIYTCLFNWIWPFDRTKMQKERMNGKEDRKRCSSLCSISSQFSYEKKLNILLIYLLCVFRYDSKSTFLFLLQRNTEWIVLKFAQISFHSVKRNSQVLIFKYENNIAFSVDDSINVSFLYGAPPKEFNVIKLIADQFNWKLLYSIFFFH